MYGGGRQCNNGGRWNSVGAVLSAAWSEATRLPVCRTVTSAAETPTSACDILTVSQSCCIIVGSAVDISHAV